MTDNTLDRAVQAAAEALPDYGDDTMPGWTALKKIIARIAVEAAAPILYQRNDEARRV